MLVGAGAALISSLEGSDILCCFTYLLVWWLLLGTEDLSIIPCSFGYSGYDNKWNSAIDCIRLSCAHLD